MNDQTESITETALAAASNPKVATVVGAGAASAGAAAQLDIITGWMARGSVAIGLCTAAVVLAIQIIKLARELREYRQMKD